uniref:Thioredoxin like 4A n=1 Tax=Oncorhynchus tshawytscha TaxID=74940 RepID=A0AAZ3PQA7_ONCTS
KVEGSRPAPCCFITKYNESIHPGCITTGRDWESHRRRTIGPASSGFGRRKLSLIHVNTAASRCRTCCRISTTAGRSTKPFYPRRTEPWNKHIMIDLGTGNNNKINWTMEDKQEMIDIVETVYRGARKGRGLVVSPKDYSTKYRY